MNRVFCFFHGPHGISGVSSGAHKSVTHFRRSLLHNYTCVYERRTRGCYRNGKTRRRHRATDAIWTEFKYSKINWQYANGDAGVTESKVILRVVNGLSCTIEIRVKNLRCETAVSEKVYIKTHTVPKNVRSFSSPH